MSRSPNKEGGRNSGPRGPCEGRGDRATRSVREPELQLLGAASRSAKTAGGGCWLLLDPSKRATFFFYRFTSISGRHFYRFTRTIKFCFGALRAPAHTSYNSASAAP
jgi:hypothetical protein